MPKYVRYVSVGYQEISVSLAAALTTALVVVLALLPLGGWSLRHVGAAPPRTCLVSYETWR